MTSAKPCRLVTAKEARAIVGSPLARPIEGPQGPTCIFRARKGSAFITVSLLPGDLSTLKSRLREPRSLRAAGRPGYCGSLGQPVLYVSVARGWVLTVSGACPIAARFAAKAVDRLDPS